ncbi:MAG: ASCH domain-containing protein [Thermoguttaceae bacterium]
MLLLSIRPHYVEKIFDGRKTVELRKRAPNCPPGEQIVIYSTMPEKLLVGLVEVEDIVEGSPDSLWRLVAARSCVGRRQYRQYYAIANSAVGIFIGHPRRFQRPVPLNALRDKWRGFHPPQSHIYLSEQQAEFVAGLAYAKARGHQKSAATLKAA